MEDQLKTVTRVEVIDNEGRAYVKYGVEDLQLQFQDNGTTLKIFLKAKDGATYQDWQRGLDE